MSKILSTGIAMASLLFSACGAVDDATPEAELNSAAVHTQSLQPGEACGGFRGGQTDCGKGAYCAYPIALQCGAGDQQGVCTTLPDFCPRGIRFDPMCGCDGNTYDGGCTAAAAGTSVQRVGACDQNITGSWSYKTAQEYSYTFNPDGTFTRIVRPVCLPDLPCTPYLIESAGNYNLQGRLIGLLYTSAADQGRSAQLGIEGNEPAEHLKGNDAGIQVDLTRER